MIHHCQGDNFPNSGAPCFHPDGRTAAARHKPASRKCSTSASESRSRQINNCLGMMQVYRRWDQDSTLVKQSDGAGRRSEEQDGCTESSKIPCAQCCGWGLLSWQSHLCCVSHDPLPGTPAREKSEAVSMATGSGSMSARGGGRRDWRACSKCGLLFLITADALQCHVSL